MRYGMRDATPVKHGFTGLRCGMRNAGCWMLVATMLLLTVFSSAAQMIVDKDNLDEDMEITGFRVPEYDGKGVMTSQLFGDRAEAQGGGLVKINGVRMEFYKEGETFMEVTSPYCTFNQKTQEASSDAPVTADMEGIRVRGRGFILKSGERKVKILDDSKVMIENAAEQGAEVLSGSGSQTGEVTVITSKELYLDYSGKKVRFEKNVHVEDSQLSMDCNIMNIRFNENNEIDWIEALTDVKLLSEGREAYAGRVVYDVSVNEFLLEDSPKIMQGRNMLLGERIRFWRDSSRMVCEPSARLVFYSDDENNVNLFGN